MKNNKINEYRENLAKTFLSVLEEKQLDWKKDGQQKSLKMPKQDINTGESILCI